MSNKTATKLLINLNITLQIKIPYYPSRTVGAKQDNQNNPLD